MKYKLLFIILILTLALCACGESAEEIIDASDDWVGVYELDGAVMNVAISDNAEDSVGTLLITVGDNFRALELPSDGVISTKLLDGSGTVTLTLGDGSISVAYDANAASGDTESDFAPPVGIYVKK